MAALKTAKCSH